MRIKIVLILFIFSFYLYGETNVLFIHSSPQSFPWTIGINNGINEALSDYPNWTLFSESLDDPLVDISSNPEFWLSYIKEKFKNINLDGVLVGGNIAGNLISEYGKELFGDIPIIIYSDNNINHPENYFVLNTNQNDSIIETLKLAINQNPNKKKVVIINGNAPLYKVNKGDIGNIINMKNMEIEEINNFTYNELLDRVSELSGKEIVLYFLVRKDSEGSNFVPGNVLKEISKRSPSPIYTFWNSLLDKGVVGGVMIDNNTIAKELFRALNDYLKFNNFNLDYKTTHVFLDWKVMNKFSIDSKIVGDYSSNDITYLNEPIPLLDIYYYEIIGGGIIFIVTFTIISVSVFLVITKQKKALNRALKYQKSLIKEQESLKNDLIEASKLSSLGMMVAGVAHELNTPLGSAMLVTSEIISDCDFVKKNVIDSLDNTILSNFIVRTLEGMSLINKNQIREAELIDRFKRLSYERTKSEIKNFKIINLLMDLEQIITPTIKGKNVRLNFTVAEELEVVSLYGPLSQVLQNLIMNSLHHAFNKTKRSTNEIDIVVETNDDSNITILVSDNGSGIDKSVIDKVFDPFVTTNRSAGNTGLV